MTATTPPSSAEATGHDAALQAVWHDIGRPELDHPSTDHQRQLAAVISAEFERIGDDARRQAGLRRCLRTAAIAVRRVAEARVQTRLDSGEDLEVDDTGFEDVLLALWRDQLGRSIHAATIDASPDDDDQVAVGFIDLAGYSARSQQLPTGQLVELIDRFDSAASLITARHGASLIKTIGDEVMYRHPDPAAAARVAIDFLEHCAADDLLLNARAGIAWGPVVEISGDIYGPSVNLAARLVQLARPGSVLVDTATADFIQHEREFEIKPLRPQELRGCGMRRPHVVRRASSPPHHSSTIDESQQATSDVHRTIRKGQDVNDRTNTHRDDLEHYVYVGDVELEASIGDRRTVDELTRSGHLVLLVLDGARRADSIDALNVFNRLRSAFADADANFGVVVVGEIHPDLAERIASFSAHGRVFEDRTADSARSLGATTAPTVMWIDAEANVAARIDGWTPQSWRRLFHRLADELDWPHPVLPLDHDPLIVFPQPLPTSAPHHPDSDRTN